MSDKIMSSQAKLGFGASGAWSKRWFSAREAERLVARALERGISHFDTASFYADGLAETRLGKALAKAKTSDIEISTKTGTQYKAGRPTIKDFTAANLRKDTETSLKRLGRERLDILYLHGPSKADMPIALETFAALKREGKIKLAGVCGFRPELEYAVSSKQIDIIMGAYNVLDLSHKAVFQAAKMAGMRTIGIATMVPGLGQKNLARPKSAADIWYLLRALKHPQTSLEASRARLQAIAERNGNIPPEELMLRFALANPDIDTVLTNTTRIAHLDANIDAANAPPLAPDLIAELMAFATVAT